MWARKRFNMGTLIFFETCPKCLPETIKLQSPNEATLQIESLQQSLEALTSTALNMSRDIRRLQTELQFIMMDIEENDSTSNLDTDTFNYLCNKLTMSLEEKIHLMMNSSRDEPPTMLEQISELHADMLEQLKRQQEGNTKTESVSIYALIDVLKQLDQLVDDAKSETLSLQEYEFPEFRESVNKLRADLEDTKHILEDIPHASWLSHDVCSLSDRYLLLLQDMNRKHNACGESEAMQQRIEEMERQHAAEVEALRAQLNAFMNTTVAANVIAVEAVASAVDDGGNAKPRQQESTIPPCTPLPAPVAQVQVVGPLPMNRHCSVVTVEAERVIPVVNLVDERHCTSAFRESDTAHRLGDLANVPETHFVRTNSTDPSLRSNATMSLRTNAEISAGNHTSTRNHTMTLSQQPSLILSEMIALENLDRLLENVTDPWTDILHIMKDHPSSPLIQATALENIACLTQEPTTSSSMEQRHLEENRRKICYAGGIDLILKALRQFPRNDNVQKHGLRAIGTVSKRNKENAVKFGEKGAIELVEKGMRQFADHIYIQRNGLFTLGILVFNIYHHKTKIRDSDGIAFIMSNMQKFRNDDQIQRHGLSCLANLISNHVENRSLFSEMGGADIILSAMKRFPQDVMVQDVACWAIAFLAKSPEGHMELRRKGAATAVLKAMSVIGNQSNSASKALCGLESREEQNQEFET
jgi:hypothetical protein